MLCVNGSIPYPTFGARGKPCRKVLPFDSDNVRPPRIIDNFYKQQEALRRIQKLVTEKPGCIFKGGTELP